MSDTVAMTYISPGPRAQAATGLCADVEDAGTDASPVGDRGMDHLAVGAVEGRTPRAVVVVRAVDGSVVSNPAETKPPPSERKHGVDALGVGARANAVLLEEHLGGGRVDERGCDDLVKIGRVDEASVSRSAVDGASPDWADLMMTMPAFRSGRRDRRLPQPPGLRPSVVEDWSNVSCSSGHESKPSFSSSAEGSMSLMSEPATQTSRVGPAFPVGNIDVVEVVGFDRRVLGLIADHTASDRHDVARLEFGDGVGGELVEVGEDPPIVEAGGVVGVGRGQGRRCRSAR